jgi:hypothetical protein
LEPSILKNLNSGLRPSKNDIDYVRRFQSTASSENDEIEKGKWTDGQYQSISGPFAGRVVQNAMTRPGRRDRWRDETCLNGEGNVLRLVAAYENLSSKIVNHTILEKEV